MTTNKVFRVEGEIGIDLKGFLSELQEARKMVREELFGKINKRDININFKINNTALEQNLKTAHNTVKNKIKSWEENTLKLNLDFNKEKLKTRVDSLVSEVRRELEKKMKINFRFEPESRNNAVKDFEDLSQTLNDILKKNVYVRPKVEVDKEQLGKALDLIEAEIKKRDLGAGLSINLDNDKVEEFIKTLQKQLEKGVVITPVLDIDEKDSEIKAQLKSLKKKLRGIVGDNLEIYPTLKFKKNKNTKNDFVTKAGEYYKDAGEKIGNEISKNIKIVPNLDENVEKEIQETLENYLLGKSIVLKPRFKLSHKTNFNHIYKNLEDAFQELGKNLTKVIEQNLETRPKIKPYVDFDEDNLKSELFQISARISKLLEEDLVLKPKIDLTIDKFLKSSIEKFRLELKNLLEKELTINPKIKIDNNELRDLLDGGGSGSPPPPNRPGRGDNSFGEQPNRRSNINNIFNNNNNLPLTSSQRNRISTSRRSNVRTGNNFDNFSYITLSERGLSTNVIEKVPAAFGLMVVSIQTAVELLVAGFERSLELAQKIVEVAAEGFSRYLNLDESIQTVKALSVTDETAPTNQEIEALKDTIRETASSLPLTLEEISNGVIVLKRAGAGIDQIVESYISAVAKAAVATGENFELLSDVATSADVVFKNTDILTILDKLSFSANESKLEFQDLGQSIKALKGVDIGIDNFSVLNQILADIGIRGGTAGTAIRNFVNFATKKAGELKGIFGIDVFNPDGSIKDVLDIMIQISQLLPQLNDVARFQLGNLFGERGQVIIQAINNLTTDELLSKYEDLAGSVGLIDEQVDIMMKGISGSVKQLVANFDSLLTFDIGEGLENLGFGFVEGLNFIIEQLSSNGGLKNRLQEIGNKLYTQIFDSSGNINNNAQESLITLADGIENIFVKTIDNIVDFLATALNNPEAVISLISIFENIFGLIIDLISFTINNIDTITQGLQLVSSVTDTIINRISSLFDRLKQIFDLLNIEEITNQLINLSNSIENTILNQYDKLIEFIELIKNIETTGINFTLFSEDISITGEQIQKIKTTFAELLSNILNTPLPLNLITENLEKAENLLYTIKDYIIEFYNNLVNIVNTTNIINSSTGAWESFINLITKALNIIKETGDEIYQNIIIPIVEATSKRMLPLIDSVVRFVSMLMNVLDYIFEVVGNVLQRLSDINKFVKLTETGGRLLSTTISLILNTVEFIVRAVTILSNILLGNIKTTNEQSVIVKGISDVVTIILTTLKIIAEVLNGVLKGLDWFMTKLNQGLTLLQSSNRVNKEILETLQNTNNEKEKSVWFNNELLNSTNKLEVSTNKVNGAWGSISESITNAKNLLDEFIQKTLNLQTDEEKEKLDRVYDRELKGNVPSFGEGRKENEIRLTIKGSGSKRITNEEFNALLALGLLESSEDSIEGLRGRIAAIQTVINRAAADLQTASSNPLNVVGILQAQQKSLLDYAFAEGQYQPFFGRKPSEFGTREQVINELISQRGHSRESAAKIYDELANALLNNHELVNAIAVILGGRTSFKAVDHPATLPPRPGDPILGGNYFHEESNQTPRTLREIFSRTSGAVFELGESIKDAGESFLIHGAKIEDILNYQPLPGQAEFAARDNGSRRHSGLDFDSSINAIPGTPIYNVIPGGRVEETYTADSQGFKGVRIAGLDASGNEIYTALNHLQNLQVAVGDILAFGQQVGEVGWHHLDFKGRINNQPVFVKEFLDAIYKGKGEVRLLDGGSVNINLNGTNQLGDLAELPLFPGALPHSSNSTINNNSLEQRIANVRSNLGSTIVDQQLVDRINRDALLSLQEGSDKKLKKIKLPGISSINEAELGLNIDGDDTKTVREFNKYLEKQLETRRELLKTIQREYETRIDLVTDTLLNTEDPLQRTLLEQEKDRLQLQQELNLKTQQRLFYMQDIEKLGELTNQGLLDYVKKYEELINQNEREVAEAFYQSDRESNKTIIQTLTDQIDALKDSSDDLQTSLNKPTRSETQLISDEIDRIKEKYEKINTTIEIYQDYINRQLDSSISLNDIQRNRLELQQSELRILQLRLAKEQRISLEYLNQLDSIIQKREELERETSYNEIEINRLRLESQLANELPWGEERANELNLEADRLERELELKQRLFELEQRRFELENIYSDDPDKLNQELQLLSAKEIALQNQFLLQEKIVQQQLFNASIWGQLRQTLYQNIEQSLVDIILQTKSVGDAFKSMINEVLSLIIRSGIRKLLSSLFSGLFGSGGGVLGFNSGGLVNRGVGANIDSVPALLTRGEYVLNRRAVEAIGVKTLDGLNRNYATIKKYNSGGLVDSKSLSKSLNTSNQQQRFVFETVKIGEQEFVSTEQLTMFENKINRRIVNSQQETTASVYEGMVKSNSLRQRLRI